MDDLATRQFLELERRHWWFEGRRRVFFSVLRRHLGAAGRLRILDVGCGVGGMMQELREFGEPAGLELSLEMLRRARERGFPRLLCGSAEALPVQPASLDLVTAFDCIEHLEHDREALAGFARALRPGGHLFLSVPAYQFLYAQNDRIARHQRRYRRGVLRRRVEEAGFEVLQSSYINAFLFPLILPAVLLLKWKQRLKPRATPETNLSYVPPAPLNRLLAWIFGSEGRWLGFLSFPAGHSLILLARRP